MKCVIVFFAVACIFGVQSHAIGDEKIAHIHKDLEQCATESNVQKSILDDMRNGKHFVPTRELDCFSACVLKKNGVMNEDGTLNHKSTDSAATTACKNLVGTDDCNTAGKVMECYAKSNLLPKIEH